MRIGEICRKTLKGKMFMGLVRKVLGNVAQLLLIWPLIWVVLLILGSVSGDLGEETLLEMLCSIPPFDDFSALGVEIINTIKGEKSYVYIFSSYFEELIENISNNIAECFIIGLWVYIFTNVQEFLLGKKFYPIIATFLGICCGCTTLYLTHVAEIRNTVPVIGSDSNSDIILTYAPYNTSYATWIAFIILLIVAYIIGFLYCMKACKLHVMRAALRALMLKSIEMGYSAIMTALWVTTIIFLPADNLHIIFKVIFCLLCIGSVLLLFYIKKTVDAISKKPIC